MFLLTDESQQKQTHFNPYSRTIRVTSFNFQYKVFV